MASDSLYGLRHEAGLSAGRVLQLQNGRYAFGPKPGGSGDSAHAEPDVVTFELTVSEDAVSLTPGQLPVTIDGRPVTRNTRLLPGQMIEAGHDRFVLEPHGRNLVPPAAPRRLVAPRLEPLPSKKALRPRASKKRIEEADNQRKRQLSRFAEEVEQTVRAEAMNRRSGTGSPVEVRRAAERGSPYTKSGEGIFAVGLTRQPMAFSLEVAGDTGEDAERILRRYRQVSSVPFLIDLNHHRLGVIGRREATLAVVRHLLAANATSKAPLLADVHVDSERLADWHEVATLTPLGPTGEQLVVVDQDSIDIDPPTALVVATSSDTLPVACSAILEIGEDGTATITLGDDPPVPIVPIGIDAEQAAEIDRLLRESDTERTQTPPAKAAAPSAAAVTAPRAPVPATVPAVPVPTPAPVTAPPLASAPMAATQTSPGSGDLTTGAVLVTGPNPETTTEVLSSLTVDLLLREENHDVSVHVIDGSSRSLIRLRQLPQTRNYAAVDDLAAVEQLLGDLETTLNAHGAKTAVLIANQVGPLVEFCERMDRADLRDKLGGLIGSHDRVKLLVAASGPTHGEVPAAFLPRFAVRLRCDDAENGRLESGSDQRKISISGLSGHDLTRSVASLLFGT